MPHEPKRRHSKERKGKRRASIKLVLKKGVICPNCSAVMLPHTVCKSCGYYKGIKVVNIKDKSAKKTA